MKRIGLLIVYLTCFLLPVAAQDDTKVVLPDLIMRQVVSRIVTYQIKPSRSPRTIYFSDSNLKKEWLPRIRNISFVLLDGNGYHYGQKGYDFQEVERFDGGYSIGLSYGEIGCSGYGYGRLWSFRVNRNKVRLWPTTGHFGWNCDANAAPKF